MNFRRRAGQLVRTLFSDRPKPVVHLELHSSDLGSAREFYESLCGWQTERVSANGGPPYLSLDFGGSIGGGVVECATPKSLWLPYVEVDDIRDVTERAPELGARVLLSPREGPAGWRSVVASPAGGELAFWQPKR
jgi:uncharacterized protein